MAQSFIGNINKYQNLAGDRISTAIARAAEKTGADFSFLMKKAQTESSFNPKARAKTSSATGLFQFIDQTWLTMVKRHGEKHGLGEMAEKIEIRNGRATVADPAARREILDLRYDAGVSALMAGEFCAENRCYLESATKGKVGGTELYLAHFLGAGSAAKFINARAENGAAPAADLFPAAARANKSIFYDRTTGQARSLDDVYARFEQRFAEEGQIAAPAPQGKETAQAIRAAGQALIEETQDIARKGIKTLTTTANDTRAEDGDAIAWRPAARHGRLSTAQSPVQRLTPEVMMTLSFLQETAINIKDARRDNAAGPRGSLTSYRA